MARQIARQAFLLGALGAVAGGLVGSCRPAADSPAPAASRATPAISGPHGWSSLDDAIDGTVVLPSNDQYASAKAVFNARFADSMPVAVVIVKSTDDVRKAVAFATDNGIQVASRSGGRSYIGASTASGAMVIDLRQLPRGAHDEPALATISPAADLDSVQTE